VRTWALIFGALLVQGMPSAGFGGLPADFAAALDSAGVKPQQISIWFGEAGSAEARFHWLPETPRNPASVLKLVTTAQALDTLGPQYRWTTTACARRTCAPSCPAWTARAARTASAATPAAPTCSAAWRGT
jgi:D-alanyl-D-alanine carboxypeptidase